MIQSSIVRFVTITLVLSGVLFAGSAPAKDKKITKKDLPTAVLSAFEKSYPNATIKGLSTETESKVAYFEIESVDGKVNRDILYTADGKAAEIEETVAKGDLPKEIQTTLSSAYAKSKIVKIERVTKDSTIGYEIQIKTGKKSKGLSFDATGKLLKKEAKKTEKDEDEKDEEEED